MASKKKNAPRTMFELRSSLNLSAQSKLLLNDDKIAKQIADLEEQHKKEGDLRVAQKMKDTLKVLVKMRQGKGLKKIVTHKVGEKVEKELTKIQTYRKQLENMDHIDEVTSQVRNVSKIYLVLSDVFQEVEANLQALKRKEEAGSKPSKNIDALIARNLGKISDAFKKQVDEKKFTVNNEVKRLISTLKNYGVDSKAIKQLASSLNQRILKHFNYFKTDANSILQILSEDDRALEFRVDAFHKGLIKALCEKTLPQAVQLEVVKSYKKNKASSEKSIQKMINQLINQLPPTFLPETLDKKVIQNSVKELIKLAGSDHQVSTNNRIVVGIKDDTQDKQDGDDNKDLGGSQESGVDASAKKKKSGLQDFFINVMSSVADILSTVITLGRMSKSFMNSFGLFFGASIALLSFAASAYYQAFQSKSTSRSRLIKLTLSLSGLVLVVAGLVTYALPLGGVLLSAATVLLCVRALYRVYNAKGKYNVNLNEFEKLGDDYSKVASFSEDYMVSQGWGKEKVAMKLELDRRQDKIKSRLVEACLKLTGSTVSVTILVFSMIGLGPLGVMVALSVCALSSGLIETYYSHKALHYASFSFKGSFYRPSEQVTKISTEVERLKNKPMKNIDTDVSGPAVSKKVKKNNIWKK
ncbi:MAG TPA: hypothetical protein QF353_03930 [Gammaproteobacteria bacterium]|nr:hypothetical protein [Gammaproteobacteria bacterium]